MDILFQNVFQVASSSLDSSLLKYSAKEYFFRAALCHLCVDVLNAQQAMERYIDLYPTFQDSREYKLLKVFNNSISVIDVHYKYPIEPLQV